MFENWNSLGIFTHSWKMERLNHLVQDLQVDLIAGCETQCDWCRVPQQRQFLQLLCPGTSTVGVAAHNVNEMINREQMGGTALAAIGRLSNVVTETGCDGTGLGRWSWLKLGNGRRTTRVIYGYLPCKLGKTLGDIQSGNNTPDTSKPWAISATPPPSLLKT